MSSEDEAIEDMEEEYVVRLKMNPREYANVKSQLKEANCFQGKIPKRKIKEMEEALQRVEQIKKRQREYRAREDVKKKRQEYIKRPEVVERRKNYYMDPQVQERKRVRDRCRREILRNIFIDHPAIADKYKSRIQIQSKNGNNGGKSAEAESSTRDPTAN
jgi:hypothetical protein